jgi:trehalose 6-phosphate phosphatase
MHYLFSPSSLPVLERLARERTLCAFDFDGTLAPIVAHPDNAALRHRTRALLSRLAALYPCVILSGRRRADLAAKLDGVPVARLLGSHGAESEQPDAAARARVAAWRDALATRLEADPRIWVEDKDLSLAVHYRQFPAKAEARRRILLAAAGLPGARVFGGKQVVNIVEADAPHKGSALAAERHRLHCNWVLFVGDDDNDEDAFALPGNTVPVRVGRKLRSHARYYLRRQSEIDRLLELLVGLRAPGATPTASGIPSGPGTEY